MHAGVKIGAAIDAADVDRYDLRAALLSREFELRGIQAGEIVTGVVGSR